MGAYNWVLIEGQCPACGPAAAIRCQIHAASDYAGDATGRFFDRTYRIGERMAWRPDDVSWSEDPGLVPCESGFEEPCYSDCLRCGAALCVVLRYRDLVPVAVVHVSRESDWPPGHPR